jgi:hypothetical protein
MINVTPSTTAFGSFIARSFSDRPLCTSRTPFCASARLLMAAGAASSAEIEMRHEGDADWSLRSNVGTAAALTVRDDNRKPTFALYKAFPCGTVRPRYFSSAATQLTPCSSAA